MSRDKEIRESNPIDKPSTKASPSRPNRLPLIIGIILLLLVVAAAIVGGLFFFGVFSFGGEETPTPTATPVDITDPISEADACSAIPAISTNRYCRTVEIESDSTWTNASLLPQELISTEMGINAAFLPGTQWIVANNPQQAISKVIWLPEGETIQYARVFIDFGATHPLASITINGETFIQGPRGEMGTNFTYAADEIPSSVSIFQFLRFLPDGTNRAVNFNQILVTGRNLIEFRFADENALVVTEEPEATVEADATAVPKAPLYALLAQVRIPVTGEYNTVATDRFFTDTDWQDAPYVGFLPTAEDEVLGAAQWIQATDIADSETGLVTVEKIFYLPEDAPNFNIAVDVREATLQNIRIFDSQGNSRNLALPPNHETVRLEGGLNFQRYVSIPFTGFRTGINRLEVSYAPNSTGHYIRLHMTNTEGETIFVSDASWLRGAYRIVPEIAGGELNLNAQVEHGESHVRGYLAIPNSPEERATGNLLITCLQPEGRIGCSNISIRHENIVYGFGSDENPQAITLVRPQRLFSLDLSFQSDSFDVADANIRLGLAYVDEVGNTVPIGAGSMWYGYEETTVVSDVPNVWTVIPDAAFIESPRDDEQGVFVSVYETTLPLPLGAVVTNSILSGSIDDQLLAIYINDYPAYIATGDSEDFRQVTNFLIDAALLREGENRLVLYVLNRGGRLGLALRFDVNYFTLFTQ